MKIAIKNTQSVADIAALKALTPSNNDIVKVESETQHYYFFANATQGDVKPDAGSGHWYKDLSADVRYVVDDSYDFAANDAQDLSSIQQWDSLSIKMGAFWGFRDAKAVQREVKTLVDQITSNDWDTNWDNLTSVEKTIVCKWCTSSVPRTRFVEVYPDAADRFTLSQALDKRNTAARKKRYQYVRMYLFGKIAKSDILEGLSDAVREGVVETYVQGIESKAIDGRESLVDFLKATSGTSFDGSGTTDGLAIRSYSIIDGSGDTLEEVADHAADNVLINGMY